MPTTDPVRITIEVDDRGTVKVVTLGKEAEKAFERTGAAADKAGSRGRRALDEIGDRAAPRVTKGLEKAQVAAVALSGGLTGMGGAAARASSALSTLLFTGFNPIAIAIAAGSVALGAWISKMEESKVATKEAAAQNKAFEESLVEIDRRVRALRTGEDPAVLAARDARDKARREFEDLERMVRRLQAAAFPGVEADDSPGARNLARLRAEEARNLPGGGIDAAFAPRPETLARLGKLGEELQKAQRLLDALNREQDAEAQKEEVEDLTEAEKKSTDAIRDGALERLKSQQTLVEQLAQTRRGIEDQITTALRLEGIDPGDTLARGFVEFDETLRRTVRDVEDLATKILAIGGEDENILPPLAVAGVKALTDQLRALEQARVGAARARADAEKLRPAESLASDMETEIEVLSNLADATEKADREFLSFAETLEDRVAAAVRALSESKAEGAPALIERLHALRDALLRAKEGEIEARRAEATDVFVRDLEREGDAYRLSLRVVDDYTRALEELNAEEAKALSRPGLKVDEEGRIAAEFRARRASLAAADLERPFVEEALEGADAFMDTLSARIMERRLDLEDLGREVSNIIARGMIEALLEATIGDSVRNAFLEIFRAIPSVLGLLGGAPTTTGAPTGGTEGAGVEVMGDPGGGVSTGTGSARAALVAAGEPYVVVNLVAEPAPVVTEEVFNRLPAEARRGFVTQATTLPSRGGRRNTE